MAVVNQINNLINFIAENIEAGAITTKDLTVQGTAFVAETIKAGAIETKNVTTDSFLAFQGTIDNLLINGGLVSPVIQTETISPLADGKDVKIQIGNREASESGQLTIENASGSAVATIDEAGNASFSGEVHANKVSADEITATSLSGLTREKIEETLKKVESDQNLLSQAQTWNTNTATDSAQIDKLALTDLYVTGTAAMTSLSLSQSVAIGADFIIQSNSINTLSSPLSLQSLALAPVEIMAGKVKINTNGDLEISGNLYVEGKVETGGLSLKAKDDTSLNDLLSIQTASGSAVASLDASGSAKLASLTTNELVIASPDSTESAKIINGEIVTNATVGKAIIPTDTSGITIRNPKISDYSLVYVTPTSSTKNNVLYVKSKGAGFFTVGFENAIEIDVNFNWWIIEAKN